MGFLDRFQKKNCMLATRFSELSFSLFFGGEELREGGVGKGYGGGHHFSCIFIFRAGLMSPAGFLHVAKTPVGVFFFLFLDRGQLDAGIKKKQIRFESKLRKCTLSKNGRYGLYGLSGEGWKFDPLGSSRWFLLYGGKAAEKRALERSTTT